MSADEYVGTTGTADPARGDVPPPNRRSRWTWAVTGVAAATAGMGVAEILAALIGSTSSPIIAMAQAFIDRTPAWLKDAAISTFGTHDKQALLMLHALLRSASTRLMPRDV